MRNDINAVFPHEAGSFRDEHSALKETSITSVGAGGLRTEGSESGTVVTIPGARKGNQTSRRYQLHLWISAKEYAMLKELAELHDEPMSRIVRRMFAQLKHQQELKAG